MPTSILEPRRVVRKEIEIPINIIGGDDIGEIHSQTVGLAWTNNRTIWRQGKIIQPLDYTIVRINDPRPPIGNLTRIQGRIDLDEAYVNCISEMNEVV